MKAFLKIGIDQFLVSLSLFAFSTIVVSITTYEDYARYSNMFAVLVFMQGLIQATIGEQLIYGWKTANYINLIIVLFALAVGVIAFIDISIAHGGILSLIIIAAILASFYPTIRALLYAYKPKQGSVLSIIFSVLLMTVSIVVLIFRISDAMYLFGAYLLSQIFSIILALLLRGIPQIDYSNFRLIKSVSLKQIAYHLVLFLGSGLIFILAEKIDAELTGKYRKVLFFVYPVNQVIAVVSLWLVPMLRNNVEKFIDIARKIIILNLFVTPLVVILFYFGYNEIIGGIELSFIELCLLSGFALCLIPNVILAHYMKFRQRWKSLIVGQGSISILYVGGFLFSLQWIPNILCLLAVATMYQYFVAIYNLYVLRR